ncbi:MAG: AAA family ATPase [Gemmataceae bacterium]|nr:AAA family ATPase [Gemmataceae bacterium]
MIERIYANNFRCFENFTLDLTDLPSALIVGGNGSGKSTLRHVLRVLQSLARGASRIRHVVEKSDFTRGRTDIPLRLEVDLQIEGRKITYALALEFPEHFREARVQEELLEVDGIRVFSRSLGEISFAHGAASLLDWHLAALPIVSVRDRDLERVRRQLQIFLGSMVLISPTPTAMVGYAEDESTELEADASNLAAWLMSLLSRRPAAYNDILTYLRSAIPDFDSFGYIPRGERGKQLTVTFRSPENAASLPLEFRQLSDGEKCLLLSAVVIASNADQPVFCFWDEPDNHLSLSEVGHFITALRKMIHRNGQFIATSHHPETIRRFSSDSTIVFSRKSHLEPTSVQLLSEKSVSGDLIHALLRDEVLG